LGLLCLVPCAWWQGGCCNPPAHAPLPLTIAQTPLDLQLRFRLVHRLARPSSKAGAMWVGELEEGPDRLFR
jgi:hypothetical protein